MESEGDSILSAEIIEVSSRDLLPPAMLGTATPEIMKRVENFYFSVAEIFERWVSRRESPHTQRAYRADVMTFVKFAGIEWPRESHRMLMMTIKDVQMFRDDLRV